MPTYEYQNDKGELREIVASMKSPPPEAVVFLDEKTWIAMTEGQACEDTGSIFRRVWSAPTIDAGAVRSKYPIVSNTLPHNLPGCRTDRFGRSIVENKAHEDRIKKQFGFAKGF